MVLIKDVNLKQKIGIAIISLEITVICLYSSILGVVYAFSFVSDWHIHSLF